MTIDQEHLKDLAEAATQGAWGSDGSYIAPSRQESGTTYVESWRALGQMGKVEDARFVAAANPATVLALLAEIKRLEGNAKDMEAIQRADSAALRRINHARDSLKKECEQLKSENGTLKAAALGIRDAWREEQLELQSLRLAKADPCQSSKRYQWLRSQQWFQWALEEQFGLTETLQEQDEQIDAAMAGDASTDSAYEQNLTQQASNHSDN